RATPSQVVFTMVLLRQPAKLVLKTAPMKGPTWPRIGAGSMAVRKTAPPVPPEHIPPPENMAMFMLVIGVGLMSKIESRNEGYGVWKQPAARNVTFWIEWGSTTPLSKRLPIGTASVPSRENGMSLS